MAEIGGVCGVFEVTAGLSGPPSLPPSAVVVAEEQWGVAGRERLIVIGCAALPWATCGTCEMENIKWYLTLRLARD